METRVLRAETWGCPHILDACKQQLSDLATLEEQSLKFLQHMPQYNIQYPHTISQLTIATLFLPFWSEHILDLGRLSEQETNTWAWGMTHQTWLNYIQPPPMTTTRTRLNGTPTSPFPKDHGNRSRVSATSFSPDYGYLIKPPPIQSVPRPQSDTPL